MYVSGFDKWSPTLFDQKALDCLNFRLLCVINLSHAPPPEQQGYRWGNHIFQKDYLFLNIKKGGGVSISGTYNSDRAISTANISFLNFTIANLQGYLIDFVRENIHNIVNK